MASSIRAVGMVTLRPMFTALPIVASFPFATATGVRTPDIWGVTIMLRFAVTAAVTHAVAVAVVRGWCG